MNQNHVRHGGMPVGAAAPGFPFPGLGAVGEARRNAGGIRVVVIVIPKAARETRRQPSDSLGLMAKLSKHRSK